MTEEEGKKETEMQEEQQEEEEDHKHDIQVHNLHGEDFWVDWHAAGGDVSAYAKENLPSFGLIGALLLTVTLPMTIEPPEFEPLKDDDGDDISKSHFLPTFFCIMMNISTAASMSLIILSVGLYTQYTNCINEASQIRFCARYGSLLSGMTFILMLEVGTMFLGCIAVMFSIYSLTTATVSLIILIVGLFGTVAVLFSVIAWNSQSNYGAEIIKHQKAQAGGKAEGEEENNNMRAQLAELREALQKTAAALENLH